MSGAPAAPVDVTSFEFTVGGKVFSLVEGSRGVCGEGGRRRGGEGPL